MNQGVDGGKREDWAAGANLTPEERATVSHWANYGQKGAMPDYRVKSWNYQAKDFTSPPKTVQWTVPLQPHQLPVLLLGFCPQITRSELDHDDYIVGDTITTRGFMSTSANMNMNATEDKWFVYAEGPDANGAASLHMHRSWSGDKMVELTIDCGAISAEQPFESPSSITHIKWDPEAGRGTSEAEAKEIVRNVCSWVLNVDLSSNEGA